MRSKVKQLTVSIMRVQADILATLWKQSANALVNHSWNCAHFFGFAVAGGKFYRSGHAVFVDRPCPTHSSVAALAANEGTNAV